MKNIVVFGKPRTFESYEFEFEEQLAIKNENTHIEPYIKPIHQKETVFHYYVKEDYACYEYYTRANGFDSERIGGVFGVGIKSDKDIKLFDAQNNVLLPFCKDLSDSFLYNGNSFNTQSIINQISRTQWSDDELRTIGNVIGNMPFAGATKGLLLLVVSDFSAIEQIESKIKEYSDVYIADNPDIFKDSNNSLYLRKSNNLIFTVEDGLFVPYKKVKKEESSKKGFVKEEYKGNNEEERRGFVKEDIDNSSNSDALTPPLPNPTPPNPTPPNPTSWWQRNSKTIYATIGTLIVVGIIAIIFNDGFKESADGGSSNVSSSGKDTDSGIVKRPEPETFVANSVQLANYDKPINDFLELNPVPLYNSSNNQTSTVSNDISLELSGVGISYAKIVGSTLKVMSNPNSDTKVTVIAKLNHTELARKEYIIAKKIITGNTNSQTVSQITENEISIHFAEGTLHDFFSIGQKIIVTAKIKGVDAPPGKGKWQITTGLTTTNVSNLNNNPVTIQISEYNANARIAYIIDGVSQSVPIRISR
ncbi:hypothetical protein AGMMS49574_07920 [Bacteroidia bacterium]|nr:hypothetical protein AGMMS49574_07920 [Bacteroidia bacterium]